MHLSSREIGASVLAASVAVALAASYATLIAGGELLPALPAILTAMLVSLGVGAAVRAWRGSAPFIVAGPTSNPTAVLAAAAATLAAGAASPAAAAAEVAVVIALTGLVAGITFIAMGRLRAGRIARYLPYPVVAGVLCGTGLLLVTGSLRLVGPTPRAIVALAIAALVIAGRRGRYASAIMLGAIVMGSAVVDLALPLFGLDAASARAAGWTFPAFAVVPSWTWWARLPGFPLDAAGTAAATIVTAVIASGLVTVFDVAAIELDGHEPVVLDTELAALGSASLVSGALGGTLTGLMGTPTMAARRSGARTRLPGIVTALFAVVVLLAGSHVLGVLARPVLAGVILATGAAIGYDWLVGSWRRLAPIDAGIVTAIATTMVAFGFVPAVALGVIAACVAFVIRYSRSIVVRDAHTLRTLHSPVERPPHQRARIEAEGDGVVILRLQGFVFFGSAQALHDDIVARLASKRPPDAIVLDFTLVEGVDASAANGLEKAARAARAADVALVFCGVHDAVERVFSRDGGALAAAARRPSLDDALMAWEEIILGDDLIAADPMREIFRDPAVVARARTHFERLELGRADVLFLAGQPPDALYLLRSGRLDVVAAGVRVRTLLPGTMVGEMAVYTGEPRSATVVASEPSVVERLAAAQLEALALADPEIADALHRAVVRAQAHRLRAANATIASR